MIVVIKNKTHQLFSEQQMLIEKIGGEIKFLEVPTEGWDLQKMKEVLESFENYAGDTKFIFVSPIPYLLKETVKKYGDRVYIFHNDRREKKTLPDGRIIQVVANEGWQLL